MQQTITQPTLEIMPYSDRYDLAQLIVVRYATPTRQAIKALMAQQYYATDLKTQEWGVATCLDAADGTYGLWIFQSLENPVPGLRNREWLQFYGNCEAHQNALDHQEAEAYATIREAQAAVLGHCQRRREATYNAGDVFLYTT